MRALTVLAYQKQGRADRVGALVPICWQGQFVMKTWTLKRSTLLVASVAIASSIGIIWSETEQASAPATSQHVDSQDSQRKADQVARLNVERQLKQQVETLRRDWRAAGTDRDVLQPVSAASFESAPFDGGFSAATDEPVVALASVNVMDTVARPVNPVAMGQISWGGAALAPVGGVFPVAFARSGGGGGLVADLGGNGGSASGGTSSEGAQPGGSSQEQADNAGSGDQTGAGSSQGDSVAQDPNADSGDAQGGATLGENRPPLGENAETVKVDAPGSMALFGLGIFALAIMLRRSRRKGSANVTFAS
ncbi:Hypothetical protein HDN1F_22270 [gamma proteobacterium HdN1]|nr:Hypothetical protein HDN1F_22270 [gamma proteobacterium HdN1]